METNWLKIFTSTNYIQSEIIKQVLNEHQIDAVVLNKRDSSHGTFGHVEVYIHREDFGDAIELLIANQIAL